jgi:hypothetical protein
MMLSIGLSVLVLVAERSWGEQTGDEVHEDPKGGMI